jgi:hypothetical protein
MKINRVMLTWDGNPFYEGFYEMHQKLWPRLGIDLSMVFVANGTNDHLIPKTGDVRVIHDRSTVPFTPPPGRNWKATMGIIHGPRLFPGEVVMVYGMDQFPASRRFINAVAEVPDDELAAPIGTISHVATGSMVAHHNTYSRIMAPAPTDFTELLHWTWERNLDLSEYKHIALGWGGDEVLFAQLMQQCPGLKVRTIFQRPWEDYLNRILGITNIAPDPTKLREGFYSDLHIRLPISDRDRNTFNTLLHVL